MAFIYNLTDTWNAAGTTFNGISMAVTNTASASGSALLNLSVSGATTGSFIVDKSANLTTSGKINKYTFTAPANGATIALADGSTFTTIGAYGITLTASGTTSLTLPTSGTLTTTSNNLSVFASTTSAQLAGVISDETGSGSLVFATSPTLVTPILGTPTSGTLTNCTGLPVGGISATGTPSVSTYLRGDGSWAAVSGTGDVVGPASATDNAVARFDGTTGKLIQNSAVTIADTTGDITGGKYNGLTVSTTTGTFSLANGKTLAVDNTLTFVGTDSSTVNFSTGGTVAYTGGTLAQFASTTSAQLAGVISDETGTGSLVFSTAPTFGTNITVGTASSSTGIVNLKGTTSGTVALSVADAAGTWTMKLPTTAGTNGYYLQTDGAGNTTWAAGGGGGGGSPGGSNTQVQFNDSGSFGGDTGFTYNKSTDAVTLGVQQTSQGSLVLANTAAGSYSTTLVASNSASAAWTMTLPTTAGSNGQVLTTNGSGVTSWSTVSASLAVGSTSISGGTTGYILYDNAGSLGEKAVTGTGDVVLATSPTLITPALGTPTSGNFSTGTFTWPTFNQNTTGTASNVTGIVAVANGGTNASSAGITAFNNITGYSATGATGTTSTNLVFSTSPTITTPTISGNETHTGAGALFLADFSNATVADRFSFQTSTTNGTTGIYALPNGTSTGAAWQAANNADPTNASKIMITTNASTDVQLVSGINGSGTYLPLSVYTSGGKSAEFSTTKGTFTLGVAGSTAGILNVAGSTSGTVSVQGAANAGTWSFTLPTSGGTNNYVLTTNGSGVSSWSQVSLTAGVTGVLPVANGGTNASSAGITAFNNITGYTASGATGTTSTNIVFSTSPTITTGTYTGLRETKTAPSISSGTLTLDCSVGNVFAVSLNASITTLSFSNVPSSGTAYSLTLAFTADGTARTISWPGAVKWPSGTAPTLTSTNAKVDTFVLTTYDGGTTWYAFVAGQNS